MIYFKKIIKSVDENSTLKKSGKASTSGVKNLMDAFNDVDDIPLENMPDYEQFISGTLCTFYTY